MPDTNQQNQPADQNQFSDVVPPLGKRLAFGTMALSGLGVLSAMAGIGISLAMGEEPSLMMAGFEAIVLVSFVLGTLIAMGKVGRDGPGMALACIGGTVLICSGFGALAAGGRQFAVGDVSLLPLLGFRVIASGLLGLFAATAVLSREGGSWKRFVVGALLALPILAAAGLAVLGKADPVLNALSSQNAVVKLFSYLGLTLLFTALVAASTQYLVTAFERAGKPPEQA